MARIILVRHGEASAAWDADADPGLSDEGRRQAEAAADALAPSGPLAIVVSPLRRTRETARPLEERWSVTARVDAGVGEIRSPDDVDVEHRSSWLREFVTGTWSAADDTLAAWRQGVIDALLAVDTDAVVVSHFVAINVAVGAAQDDDRVLSFAPGNCSRTVLENVGGALRLVELGEERASVVH